MATREELLSFIQECDDTELLEEIGAEVQSRIDDLTPEDDDDEGDEEEEKEDDA